MTHPVVMVAPDTPILEVAKLLLEHRIGGMLLVEGGQASGYSKSLHDTGHLLLHLQVACS